jgi:L-asparaginase
MPQNKPRVAMIGTGGTIASMGDHPLEVITYIRHGRILEAEALLARVPDVQRVADVVAVPFSAVPSTAVAPQDWLALVAAIHRVAAEQPETAGVVVTHGTASLEETAYFLNLTLKSDLCVVVTGAQRPATGLSGDGPMNIVGAVRAAGSPAARGLGVLVLLNDELQAAREVTKTSTMRLQTFRSPDFGILGHVDEDGVHIYRRPVRRHTPDTEFSVEGLDVLPRVDVVLSYAGADGFAIDAAVAAGAKGIVVSGFAPGLVPPAQLEALGKAREQGVVVVQSTRAGSGRVIHIDSRQVEGVVTGDNLNPWKARVLLMLALTRSSEPREIQRIFNTY